MKLQYNSSEIPPSLNFLLNIVKSVSLNDDYIKKYTNPWLYHPPLVFAKN